MAVVHGKEGVIKAGGSAIGDVTGFTLETTGDVVETTCLGESVKSFTAGTTSFSGSIDMNFNGASGTPTQTTLTAGSSIAFIVYPEGASSGDRTFTGSGIITGMSTNNSLDAMVTRSVTFQGTGALTISTV
jgi:hypothetical protein|tara:strand:- start:82 stop:474 length:393 start_codon:yes stop_codon:yes gene_type:complete